MRQVVIPASLAGVPALAHSTDCLHLEGESMGTTWQVQVHAPAGAADGLREAVRTTLSQVVRQMSHWEPFSDVSRFNAAPAGSEISLPEPLFGLLVEAQRVASLTAGAFDATAGAMVRSWGFGPDLARLNPAFRFPADHLIEEACSRSGWRRLMLDSSARCALQPGGLELDLSAIGKGFAVDAVARCLHANGCNTHLVEIGGELRGSGLKPGAQPWWVTVEPPDATAQIDETVIALCDHAVATSGDYRRFHQIGDRRFSHTIDPRTGRPVDNDIASVTVISGECWHADALSTALMVMGAARGTAFANDHGIAARFVRRLEGGYRESFSRAWGEMLL